MYCQNWCVFVERIKLFYFIFYSIFIVIVKEEKIIFTPFFVRFSFFFQQNKLFKFICWVFFVLWMKKQNVIVAAVCWYGRVFCVHSNSWLNYQFVFFFYHHRIAQNEANLHLKFFWLNKNITNVKNQKINVLPSSHKSTKWSSNSRKKRNNVGPKSEEEKWGKVKIMKLDAREENIWCAEKWQFMIFFCVFAR